MTKQKQINSLYDSGNDTKMQREGERRGQKLFIQLQNENVAEGVDLWPTISLHLLIFCLPPADKIDRIHRYFMTQRISYSSSGMRG